ncbi:hypothetical protein Ahy_B02g058747 [Arachis hypogaea]|uniref:Transposase MuDR plant domain-containing protein n=1 Tax=Arachis hypogaea TaxID=3818 RepID=A0A445AFC5_ARAHY|nr:hypothetical protein Ahy_B02g058747 [Arachis hypogaea]
MFYIYRQIRFHVPVIELYVEFEQQSGMGTVGDEVNVDELGDIDWEEENNDSKEEFEVNYEVDDENDDGDLAGNSAVQNEADAIVSQHPFGVPSFMRTLDLEAMHAPEFSEYANTGEGNVAAEDGEFSVGMEFGSKESVISAIKSYTISRGLCREARHNDLYKCARLAAPNCILKSGGNLEVAVETSNSMKWSTYPETLLFRARRKCAPGRTAQQTPECHKAQCLCTFGPMRD